MGTPSSLYTICDTSRTDISMALTTYRHGTVLVAKGHWGVVIVTGAAGQVLFDWHSYRESRSNSAAEVSDLDGLFQAVQCHGQRVHGSRKVWI